MKENITTNNDLKNKKLDKDLNKKTKTNTRKVKKEARHGSFITAIQGSGISISN